MAVGFWVGLYGMMVVARVLYHAIVNIPMAFDVHERIKEYMKGFFLPTKPQPQAIELTNSIIDNITTSCALREPLIL